MGDDDDDADIAQLDSDDDMFQVDEQRFEVTSKYFCISLSFRYSLIMSQPACVGVGYRHCALDMRLRTMGASNVVTRLTSRSVTGHALPIQVHQHYGFECHLILTADSCIRRGCHAEGTARRI